MFKYKNKKINSSILTSIQKYTINYKWVGCYSCSYIMGMFKNEMFM